MKERKEGVVGLLQFPVVSAQATLPPRNKEMNCEVDRLHWEEKTTCINAGYINFAKQWETIIKIMIIILLIFFFKESMINKQ